MIRLRLAGNEPLSKYRRLIWRGQPANGVCCQFADCHFSPEFDEIFMSLLCSLQALLISCINAAIFSLDKWNVDCC